MSGFQKGDRVRHSAAWAERRMTKARSVGLRGTSSRGVVTVTQNDYQIRTGVVLIRRDGQKSEQPFHVKYWELDI